jgi:glycosyltransferase involved in cell wall biosynthesis
MRIAMVGPYPDDASQIVRGVESVTWMLVQALRDVPGLTIDVVRNGSVSEVEKHSGSGITVWTVPRVERFGNLSMGIVERARTRAVLKMIGPDVIHNQYHFAYPYLLSQPIAPIVTHVHGLTFREKRFEREAFDWYRGLVGTLLERRALAVAPCVICVSDYVKRAIEGWAHGTLYVVENPVDQSYFEVRSAENGNTLLTVGTIIRRKNLLDLVGAVKRLRTPNVHLRVVGAVEEVYYYKLVLDYIRAEHLESRVHFLGRLGHDDLLREYAACAVVVSASSEESAGLSLEQGMAAGKAVVATRAGGVPDVVRDGECGLLCEPGNPNALADVLDRALSSRALRSSLAKSARDDARRRFSSQVAATRTLAVYKQVLAQTSSLPRTEAAL